ncbi:class II aldolase/adducin family protein [Paenibacillus sp. sptzw28]|nr:class II aldolase/adducin family protein [Paenibacillus sp. sptzw28]
MKELSFYGTKIVQKNLAVGPGGNISAREGKTMWISPSGLALDEITEDQWVAVDIETGHYQHPTLKPSSEIAMHLYIYRKRPDVNAVVHTHPPVTIAVISSGYDEIPFMFPDHVALVGKLSSIDYVVPCSEELAQAVIQSITPSSTGLLLKNHGLITIGSTFKQAYYRTELVEDAARVFWMAKLMGTPRILTGEEAGEILGLEAEKYRQKLLDTKLGG